MSGKIGTAMSAGQSVFRPGLKHLSAGWVDKDMLTIRKMAKDGATAEDMATALGWSKARIVAFIRRHKLVWNNRVRGDQSRHVMASASAISGHMRMGHAVWADEGVRLRQEGWTTKRIAAKVGASTATIDQYFRRHDIKPLVPIKRQRMANRAKMLELVIRLHVEGVLSEGQVAKATGLDRPEIRRLADQAADHSPARQVA